MGLNFVTALTKEFLLHTKFRKVRMEGGGGSESEKIFLFNIISEPSM